MADLLDQVRSVASALNYTEVVPAQVKGKSGIKHNFSALFQSDAGYFAVDAFDRVAESDVLRGRIKEQDSEVQYCIESADAAPDKAQQLAKYYGIILISPSDRGKLTDLMQIKKQTQGS